MPAEGGPARRMTWLGPDVMVRGFTPDGRILFVTHPRPAVLPQLPRVHARSRRRHAGDAAAGPGEPPGLRPRQGDGDRPQHRRPRALEALPRRHRRPPVDRRRRQRHVPPHDRARRQHHEPDVDRRARVFPVGREGVGNLYSVPPGRHRRQRHTDHDDFYARHAQTDGKRIVYQCGADIWLFDPATGDIRARSPIRVPAHRTQAARKFVAAGDYLGGFDVHPAGHSLALDVRGKLFTFGPVGRRGAPARASGRRAPSPSASGSPTARPSSRSATRRARSACRPGRTAPRARCPGTSAARSRCARRRRARWSRIANHRNEVLVGDVATGEVAVIDRSDTAAPRTSPGRPTAQWLAYTFCDRRAPLRRSSSTSVADEASRRSSRSRSSATTRRRSTPRASTSTSCRCARSIRCTTPCSSSSRSRAPRGRI